MDYDKLLNEIKRIHFIGIGGSGMCPIAEILMSEGFEISGSDMNEGETLDKMKGYGIPVYMGHAAENIKGAELVVYSAAVKETKSPALSAALCWALLRAATSAASRYPARTERPLPRRCSRRF